MRALVPVKAAGEKAACTSSLAEYHVEEILKKTKKLRHLKETPSASMFNDKCSQGANIKAFNFSKYRKNTGYKYLA